MSAAEHSSHLRFDRPTSSASGFTHIAVAIGEGVLGPCGHVGILYRDGDDVRFLHLAWHYQLKMEEHPEGFGWIFSPLLEELAMQVAARCRRIVRANPGGLPYAPGRFAKLDRNGVLKLQEGTWGFTCATFVLAVFEHAGLPLVDEMTWPRRSDDEGFKTSIVEMLEKQLERLRKKIEVYEPLEKTAEVSSLRERVRNLEAHIAGIRATETSARFRPEEVAAASSLKECPASFQQVMEPARRIAEALMSRDAN